MFPALVDYVIADHAYMIYNVYCVDGVWRVQLYNPWGNDGEGDWHDGPDEGMITLTWDQFCANFTGYYRN